MMKLAVIGLGSRGRGAYLTNLKKYKDIEVTALCDINPATLAFTRDKFAPKAQCFDDDAAFFEAGKLADWLIVATPDKEHYRHAMAALALGYHVMVEKPVTDVEAELDALAAEAKARDRTVIVCHVLRYSPYFGKIKEIIDSGVIGDLVSIVHEEGVGYWHYAHSFVRGNWCNTDKSAPFLLAKCCHDFDLLNWYIDQPCLKVSSYGSLDYFTEKNRPEGAADFCLGGCKIKDSCPYNVERLYLRKTSLLFWGRPMAAGLPNPSIAQTREALKTGDYGRCIYASNNNVCDHQVTSLSFGGGITASFAVNAFTRHFVRQTHIFGTKGELYGIDNEHKLRLNVFGKNPKTVRVKAGLVGHSGADTGICETLHKLMQGEAVNRDHLTTIDVTVKSHKMVYAALESARTGETVEVNL